MATNNRGGKRLGAGRKKVREAVGYRKPSKAATNLTVQQQADDCPKPNEYLSRATSGMPFVNRGKEIFENMWQWLKVRDCEKLINPENLQLWAHNVAKYEQHSELVDIKGNMVSINGKAEENPHEALAEKALKRAQSLWAGIEVMIADRIKFYADRSGAEKSPLDKILNFSASQALNASGNDELNIETETDSEEDF